MIDATKFSRALSSLISLPLRASERVYGRLATRVSLFGFRVGERVLDLVEAAQKLASLVERVKGALVRAGERLRSRGIRGTFSVRVRPNADGSSSVRVTAKAATETDFARADEREVLIEASLACREAGLDAFVSLREVVVGE